MVEGGLPGQTGAIFHFRPKGRFPGSGKGLTLYGVTTALSAYTLVLFEFFFVGGGGEKVWCV